MTENPDVPEVDEPVGGSLIPGTESTPSEVQAGNPPEEDASQVDWLADAEAQASALRYALDQLAETPILVSAKARLRECVRDLEQYR